MGDNNSSDHDVTLVHEDECVSPRKRHRHRTVVPEPLLSTNAADFDYDMAWLNDSLNVDQKRCLAAIVACLLPNDVPNIDFSMKYFSDLASYLQLDAFNFDPLLHSGRINPKPFIDDIELSSSDRERLLATLLLFSTSTFQEYDARVRVMLMSLCFLFGLSWRWMVSEEGALISAIQRDCLAVNLSDRSQRSSKLKRYAKVGAAVVVSSSLFMVTAGIAAPALGAGMVALGAGTGVGAFIGSVTGTALVSALFGATGAGLAGYKMNKRVRDIREFDFVPLFQNDHDHSSLMVTICVSGMLDENSEYHQIWAPLSEQEFPSERYILRWETETLFNLGNGIENFAKYQLGSAVFQETLKQTLLMGVMSALAWPSAFVTASYLIDNPWSIAVSRADKAGIILADALLSRPHGRRPVTLIGYSVGARMIYRALLELSRNGENAKGIVQDAFLLGCPSSADPQNWVKMKSVVAGRLANGYSKSDLVLKFIFRAASPTLTVSGLGPVDLETVENVDLSAVVEGHHTYIAQLPEILDAVHITSRGS